LYIVDWFTASKNATPNIPDKPKFNGSIFSQVSGRILSPGGILLPKSAGSSQAILDLTKSPQQIHPREVIDLTVDSPHSIDLRGEFPRVVIDQSASIHRNVLNLIDDPNGKVQVECLNSVDVRFYLVS